jgi:hypothetical protein
MMATVTDIPIGRGEDITLNFTVWTNPPTNTIAQDITGWTLITFTVAADGNVTPKLITKSCTILVAASGTFKAVLLAADSEVLSPGAYVWDVWRMDSGFKRLLGYGTFRVLGIARLPT